MMKVLRVATRLGSVCVALLMFREAFLAKDGVSRGVLMSVSVSLALIVGLHELHLIITRKREFHEARVEGLAGFYQHEQRESHEQDAQRWNATNYFLLGIMVAALGYLMCIKTLP